MTIEDMYKSKCSEPSDINEHLPVIKKYGEECNTIMEMGVRTLVSTWALLASKPKKLTSIDLNYSQDVELAKRLSALEGIEFEFIVGSTLALTPRSVDFLFIDTLHTYEQLKEELRLHGNMAQKYIAFHDTQMFRFVDQTGIGRGLWPAIEEFLADNPHWKLELDLQNNNGLAIIKR
jgi:hypothetical protein